jgi:hypothetical protein
MFPVRYELNSYINLLRNSVFKGLTCENLREKVPYLLLRLIISLQRIENTRLGDKEGHVSIAGNKYGFL